MHIRPARDLVHDVNQQEAMPANLPAPQQNPPAGAGRVEKAPPPPRAAQAAAAAGAWLSEPHTRVGTQPVRRPAESR